jgi:hypothetical protein
VLPEKRDAADLSGRHGGIPLNGQQNKK